MVALHAWICSLPAALRSVEKIRRLPSAVGSGLDSLNSLLTAEPRLYGFPHLPPSTRGAAQRSNPPTPPGRSEEKSRYRPSAVTRGLRSSVGPLTPSSGAGAVHWLSRR